jgi:Tol biopolymer transport system component
MNASDGSNQTALSLPAGSISPFPTLDGKYLIFQGSDGIYRADVGTGFALGSSQPIVTQVAGGQIPGLVAISPNGEKVAYVMDTPTVTGMSYVWTVNADGTDQTQITPNAGFFLPTSWE